MVKRKIVETDSADDDDPKQPLSDNEDDEVMVSRKYQMDPNDLQVYYDRLFPFNEMFRWLSYGHDPDSENENVDRTFFHRREFTFITADEVWIRYQCFENKTQFKSCVRKVSPYRIEIGPLYNEPPSMKDAIGSSFRPVEKELVFDIDMTDYDEVRVCCQDKQICNECWPLMSCAIRVLHETLTKDFGFAHLLFVFSGRRGIHCWVGDRRARALKDDARFAIGQYLSIHMGTEHGNAKLNVRQPMHHSLVRASSICEPYFLRLLESQDWLSDEKGVDRVLGFLPDSCKETHSLLRDSWLGKNQDRSSSWKFGQLRKTAQTKSILRFAVREIMLFFVYPRLDINVTRKLNHLLKSPFVIHPGTGKVCVPIPIKEDGKWIVDKFDPLTQPKVEQLHRELNKNKDAKVRFDIQRTSLHKHVENFVKSFVEPLEEAERIRRRDLPAGL
uniref:DNA primase n=1 Tax=Hirondellea gigas TaxID=1518452 RepID=A0A6A7G5L6_9CRUS